MVLAGVQRLCAHDISDSTLFRGHATGRGCYTLMDYAVIRGFLSVVQFLCAQPKPHGYTEFTIKLAAKHGHLRIVQFLYEQCERRGYQNYDVLLAMDSAVRAGHVEIVQYVYETADCPLDRDAKSRRTCERPERLWAWAAAAQRGHIGVLEYLEKHLPPAEIAGSSELLVNVMDAAIRGTRLDAVTWLHTHVREARQCSQQAFHDAIQQKARDVVAFVLTHQYPNVDFVDAMGEAAGSQDVAMLQLFHETSLVGCTTRAMDHASAKGPLEMVQFLHTRRPEGCTTAAMDNAALNGQVEIVAFLHTNRSEGCTTAAMDGAAANGHLAVVQKEGCTTDAIDQAATNGHLEVVQYLHTNRHEGLTDAALAGAARNGHFEMVRFLCESCDALSVMVGPLDPLVVDLTVQRNMLELLQYLHSVVNHGCCKDGEVGEAS